MSDPMWSSMGYGDSVFISSTMPTSLVQYKKVHCHRNPPSSTKRGAGYGEFTGRTRQRVRPADARGRDTIQLARLVEWAQPTTVVSDDGFDP